MATPTAIAMPNMTAMRPSNRRPPSAPITTALKIMLAIDPMMIARQAISGEMLPPCAMRDVESVIAGSDLLVVGLSNASIFEALARHVREDQVVLDLVNIPRSEALRAKVMGLCW